MIEAALLIALEYVAPAECPDRAQFWQAVGRGAPRVQLVGSESPRRRYSVAVTTLEKGFRGELREEGQPVPRTLAAADCRELVEALALMLALSTEQEARVDEPASELMEPEEAIADEAPPPGREPSTLVAPRSSQRAREEAPVPSTAVPSTMAAMAGGFVWFGAGPDPLLGGAAIFEHGFGPVIVARLEARGAVANARVDATFFGVAPQACASTWQPVVALTVCAGAVLGMLPIKGAEYSDSVSGRQSSAWVAPLLAARAAKSLADNLAVELTLEVQHGFIARSYHIKRDDTEFTTSPVTALIMLAVGARF